MLSPEIMERLSQLNRGATLPLSVARSQPAAPTRSSQTPLAGTELHTPWGPCWCVERPLSSAAPVAFQEFEQLFSEHSAASPTSDVHPDVRRLAGALPAGTLFLDLETCGFAGSMIFLAGLIRGTDEGPMLTQLMARSYPEEKALLQAVWQFASHHEVLVTFNGKTFDWPCVHDRSTVHHLGCDERHLPEADRRRLLFPVTAALTRGDVRPHLEHVDLLHHCRRRWKTALPNCRLQTLERHLCGRRRVADIPGAAIPEAYHRYVRAQEPAVMRSILHHNALDLITLFQLAVRVCCVEASSAESEEYGF